MAHMCKDPEHIPQEVRPVGPGTSVALSSPIELVAVGRGSWESCAEAMARADPGPWGLFSAMARALSPW